MKQLSNNKLTQGLLKSFFMASLFNIAILSQAFALNLEQAYGLAKQNDAIYLAASQQLKAANLDLPIAQGTRKPSISANAGMVLNGDSTSPDGAESASESYIRSQLGLNLSQVLYNKATDQNIQAARISTQIAQLNFGLSEENLIRSVVARYFDVLSAQDNAQLAKLEYRAIKQQLDLATQRLEVGLGTKTDQFDAKARVELSNAKIIAEDNNVQNAWQALILLIGQDAVKPEKRSLQALNNKNPEDEKGASKAAMISADDQVAIDALVSKNLAFQIKQSQVDLAKTDRARSDAIRSPILSLVAGISEADSGRTLSFPGGKQGNWNVGVQGSINLYQGGAIALQKRQAGYRLNAAKTESEQLKREIYQAILSAERGVQALKGQAKALVQAVRASKSALDAKVEGFKAGVTTNLDVLDGQQDLFRARRDHLKTRYDLINAMVELERVSGALNAEDVQRLNGWLIQ